MASFQFTFSPQWHKDGVKANRKDVSTPKAQSSTEEEAHQPLQAASARVSRASPPWGRRDWSDRHPVDLGQDTQPERLTGPTLFQASAIHTFVDPRDSLTKREAELLKRTASLNEPQAECSRV